VGSGELEYDWPADIVDDEVEAVKVERIDGRVAEPGQEAANLTDRVFAPLRIMSGGRELRFLNMVATFGTALDVTAAELVIEAFYPADPATSRALEESGQ